MSKLQPKVAIGDHLLNSLLALPSGAMKKAKETIHKFKSDPMSPGLNYESIRGCSDKRLHSIRIDRNYRGIILKQQGGAAYIFLWIDKHDAAYEWAARHKFGVNEHTGNIQIIDTEETVVKAESPKIQPTVIEDRRPDIFMQYRDEDLKRIGATDELMPLIRSIKETDDIEKLERRLPSQLYDALYMLALGENFDDVLEELGIAGEKKFDPEDFETALDLDSNQQHFLSITDDAELEAILNEPMAKWRVFLHPSQRKLVNGNFNGPVRILGGAGTGKTVVAMHRAKLLGSRCIDREKVFFTTFTKSLVADIQANLQKICSFDEIKRIDVENLDQWCMRFLRENGYDRRVCFSLEGELKNLWDKAMELLESGEFTSDFLYEEWSRVIQCNGINELPDYLRVPRTGRKGPLSRLQRKKIWPVFDEFRTLLTESQIWEQADMYRAARMVLQDKKTKLPYRYVIVDEIQDFHPEAFRLLRAMAPKELPNDLMLVGDGHQNIYGHHVVLGRLGINILGRGRKLRLNYRTPEETRKYACRILKGGEVSDMDGGVDDDKGYRSLLRGPEPDIEECDGFEAEIEHIESWIQTLREKNEDKVICVCLPTNKLRIQYGKALAVKELPIHHIDDKIADTEETLPIRLITMHRIKGLEFDDVCLAGCSAENWKRETFESKCLIHVASTRTKNSLLITSPGKMSSLFSPTRTERNY